MAREKKRLQSVQEGNLFFVRFRHPIRLKVVCIGLGGAEEHARNLQALNRIWMTPDYWCNPPTDSEMPSRIRSAWMGPDNVVKLYSGRLLRGKRALDTSLTENATLRIELDAAHQEIDRLTDIVERQAAELVHWRGKNSHTGPYPTLAEALKAFDDAYKGKDPIHTKNVIWDLKRFVEKFGAATRIDKLAGREREISGWLHGLKNPKGKTLSPSRRMQWLWYILRMIRESGIDLDKTKIDRISRKKMKEARGRIKYLRKEDATKLAGLLPDYWKSAFTLQCATGLRPDEIPTLHQDNFNDDFSELTLSPREHLTLKTGSRKIPIPSELREMIRQRFKNNVILFPQRARGKNSRYPKKRVDRLWEDPKMFDRQYVIALRTAAESIGISKTMIDARVGRRCCASWLLQDNIGADRIAALLGNTAQQVIDAYGDPDTSKLPLSQSTVLRDKEIATST